MISLKGLLLLLGAFLQTLALSSAAHPLEDADLSNRQIGAKMGKPKTRTPKYFHEAGGTMELGHYDKRYFKDKVPYDRHRLVLRDLIRSYLTVCHSRGIETWLAHGTLLGWWWNGQIMPWDYDLDVQVSNATLYTMGDSMNRTMHVFNRTQTPAEILANETHVAQTTYLLDVNPHHGELTRGDGMNIIDARWIDMDNGMYIDITGLRERELQRPGEWTCKNRHRYATQDLWPLRLSEFEGVPARVPYSFEKILKKEYGDGSIANTNFAK